MSYYIREKLKQVGIEERFSSDSASLAARVIAALLGGYAFAWGFAALGIAGLVALGMDFHEAETAILLLAFLVYLGVFLWAFAAVRLACVWAVLGGGAVLMTTAAWGLQWAVLS